MRILIIEDEFNLADAIKARLKKEKYLVDIKTDGLDGYFDATTNVYDLIILDVMLPNKDGFEILKKLREDNIASKIIMLTAKSTIEDKLDGLEHGANDYITKPFHMDELVARINIQLKNNLTNKNVLEYQDLTLDLNGYTITGTIDNLGSLTIKSSKNGGKVVSTDGSAGQATIYVGDNDAQVTGKFILESGTIINEKGYGVACFSGSTAIINDGEINSVSSSLSGNNTLGSMNFIVNGGTLNTKYGPAIYMPGPVSLTITGGILNGGISLRMGIVNISGGIINAATDNFDSLQKYYKESVNAWLEDAIYVWGGTYISHDEGTTNDLELNITGGTINNTNKLGSAVAIYDIGKVAQSIKVNISNNAKLITNSNTRNAYDVLTLPEAGVTDYVSGYNNPNYTGKVITSISGGTYSTSMAKYISDEYVETSINNEFVVAKKEVKIDTPKVDQTKPVDEISVGVIDNDELKNILVKSIEDYKLDVADINAIVMVTIDNQKEEEAPADATKSIKELAKEKNDIKVVSFFDITLNVKNNITGETLGTLNVLNDKIKFNMVLPEEITNVNEGYTRKYFIVRYHDGKSEMLPTTLEGNIITFESDKFSTYALVYEDVKNEIENIEDKTEIENPSTIDSIVIDLIVGSTSVIGLISIAKSIAKRKKYFN